MIRAWNERDAAAVMRIWLDTNCSAHSFIPKTYWLEHAQAVRRMLPLAEIYVHEDDRTKAVDGFYRADGSRHCRNLCGANCPIRRNWKTITGPCKRVQVPFAAACLPEESPGAAFLSKRAVPDCSGNRGRGDKRSGVCDGLGERCDWIEPGGVRLYRVSIRIGQLPDPVCRSEENKKKGQQEAEKSENPGCRAADFQMTAENPSGNAAEVRQPGCFLEKNTKILF